MFSWHLIELTAGFLFKYYTALEHLKPLIEFGLLRISALPVITITHALNIIAFAAKWLLKEPQAVYKL